MGRKKLEEIENAHLLDIDKLIDAVINSGLSPEVFDVDVDLPRARNVIDFTINPSFLNMPTIFAKQAEQAVKLFAEYCPKCSDMDYVNNVPTADSIDRFQERVQLLNFSICPKCKQTKKQLFKTYPNELVSCIGQRSGKTALVGGILTPYITHRYLKIPKLYKYLGLMPNTLFQITAVAVSVKQVQDTVWSGINSTIANAPWFVEYHKALKDREKTTGIPHGTLVKQLDTYIWYGNQKMSLSYQAADNKTARGRTRLIGVAEEISWMNINEDAIRANADEIYKSLSNSLMTVRAKTDILWDKGEYDVPTAYMLNISSPSSYYDKIMNLLKESKRNPRMAAFHYATWEATPEISRESLRAVEINSPITFWRDWGAVPPLANEPFISNQSSVYSINKNKTPLFQTKPKYINDGVGLNKFIGTEITSCDTDKQTARIISCDAGQTNNSFAISLHHLEKTESEVKIILDGCVSVTPEKTPDGESIISVHFPTMFELILKLCKHFNVKYVVWDRWGSQAEIQRLRDLRIKAEAYSVKQQDFIDFRNLLSAGNYETPKWELEKLEDLDLTNYNQLKLSNYTHLALQIATVRENGKKVLKPEAGDDDLFRTVILAVHYLLLHREEFLKAGLGSVHKNMASLGVVIGRSSSAGYKPSGGIISNNLGVVRGKTRY